MLKKQLMFGQSMKLLDNVSFILVRKMKQELKRMLKQVKIRPERRKTLVAQVPRLLLEKEVPHL